MKACNTTIFALLTFCLLSACSPLNNAVNPYHENFKCRASEDSGECIDTPSAYKKARYPEEAAGVPAVPNEVLTAQEQRYKILTGLLEQPQKPVLKQPRILRVLLLPYKGEAGELFMTRYVYVKVEDADWILTDLKEAK